MSINHSGKTLSIVAHLDDDILFQNPDIQQSIESGGGHTTVFMIAYGQFWQNREQGILNAYAEMAGANDWVESVMTFTDGSGTREVVTHYLASQPDVRVYFLRMDDGGQNGVGFESTGFTSLERLWDGEVETIGTIDGSARYTDDQVVGLLEGIIAHEEPDAILTHDHDSIYIEQDHSDHIYTSLFVEEAVENYPQLVDVLGYVGYGTDVLTPNLMPEQSEAVLRIVRAYAEQDPAVGIGRDADGNIIIPDRFFEWTSRSYRTDEVPQRDNPMGEGADERDFSGAASFDFESETNPPDLGGNPGQPGDGDLPSGEMTFSFGGAWVSDDNVTNTIDLPDTLADGARFWVIVQDGGLTKAIQVELRDLGLDNFSLQTVQAKYDAGSIFNQLNGDFDAIQNHFNANGTSATIANGVSSPGYGLHSVELDGAENGAAYVQSSAPSYFNPAGTPPTTPTSDDATLSYSFGGGWITDDAVSNSIELPDTLGSGDAFWVIVQDGGFTKAVQLTVDAASDGSISLRVTGAKYDAENLFAQLDGNFDAIQAHFDANGQTAPAVTNVNGGGYGIHSVSLGETDTGTDYLSTSQATTFNVTLGNGGPANSFSYAFSGGWITDDGVETSIELPTNPGDNDFWVVRQDGGFTKAIRVELRQIDDDSLALRAVEARYDDASVFNTLAGDFDAIQDHFDFNGISASVVEDINGAGYGLHEIEINGQGANQSSFAGPNQDLVFDGQQIADFIDDWFV